MSDDPGNGAVSVDKAAELLWNEWEYRHSLFWRTLFRWGAAMVTVSIVPYVKTDLIESLQVAILVFPFMAPFFSWFSAWHLSSEYARLKYISREFRSITEPYNPNKFGDDVDTWAKVSIGKTVPRLFAFAGTIGSIGNVVILLWLMLA